MKNARTSVKRAPRSAALLLVLLSATAICVEGRSPGPCRTPTAGVQAAGPQAFTYRRVGAQALKAYVFRPATTAKARPAILLFHGGGWKLGEASWLFGRAKELAQSGM